MNIRSIITPATAFAVVVSLAVAAPSMARGGAGGGGGGGTPTPTPIPAPVPNASPCALLVGPSGIAPESTKANLRLDYKVTNCSADAETVVLSVSGVQTSGNVPTPCVTATTALPALTLRAGDTRGLTLDAPGQASCRLGVGSYTYTATVSDAVTGVVLDSESTTVMRMSGV